MDFTEDQLKNLNGITSSRHGFILHFSVMEMFEEMPPTEKGLVLEAIFEYVATGNDYKKLTKGSLGYFAFKQFKSLYFKDASKWLQKSQKNSDNAKKPRGKKEKYNPETGEIID